ncbi:DinB family protein [Ensifer sp.]|uniref:DinB family protein n=1 Tax=Ensifer sp. TaxID=1872086 RepID=UPI002E1409BA|nr:DinB family protein [Ensifer sp.]
MSGLLLKLYGYHAWANAELLDALQALDRQGKGGELVTALRLMNHTYVVARIFAGHLSGAQHGYTSDNTAETPSLEDLRAAVDASDRWYADYLGRVSPADLSEVVAFTFTDGDKGAMSREEMLLHVALHGGYHRGEIGRMLWRLGMTPPWDTFAVHLHQSDPGRRLQGNAQTMPA